MAYWPKVMIFRMELIVGGRELNNSKNGITVDAISHVQKKES